MELFNIIDLIIKAGIPAFIALISITTFIDMFVVMPVLADKIDSNIRE